MYFTSKRNECRYQSRKAKGGSDRLSISFFPPFLPFPTFTLTYLLSLIPLFPQPNYSTQKLSCHPKHRSLAPGFAVRFNPPLARLFTSSVQFSSSEPYFSNRGSLFAFGSPFRTKLSRYSWKVNARLASTLPSVPSKKVYAMSSPWKAGGTLNK